MNTPVIEPVSEIPPIPSGPPTELDIESPRVRRKLLGTGNFREIASPSLVVSVVILVVVLLWALIPAAFTSFDPYSSDAGAKLLAPSWTHPFGTDALGRDVLTRFIYGTKTTLIASLLALLLAFVVSAVLGLLAGYIGGVVDDVIGRIVDIFLAVPGLLVSLMLVTGLGFGTVNIAIAVGVSSIASFTRVMRAEVLRVRQSDFVTAAAYGGVRWYNILRNHVFPHAIGPVISLTALEFGSAILSISALSFLGFGAAAPEPEWGSLVASGRDYLSYAWWLTVLPGLAIVATVLSANRISRFVERVR